ncbi:MAG: hypothetical protein HETSPECPRED_010403 [Heterodermia speciosa]|uniref:Uncharacterized protein n=1 Tax=Heterodermia speciosa TaxID=116794 RepID=A0A8H3G4Y0_9LECA|nr:MAG: hypothetical protein HETSPECPRED_010403 [Heterodermia speciosa]
MAHSIRGIVSGNTNVAEISPALANFNFDFTLWRVEAPTEFHGVGRALTRGRRAEAESGQSHITARLLGALFTSALPKTPNLIRVYGLRASEISKRAAEESSKTQSWGFFADHSGADGTTIWASATSGPESIPAHLLACLLARAWDPPEAISIWDEIVQRRRQIILDAFENSNTADLRDVWAAKHPLSRDHLAEWDNSARSWLRTADRVKQREQKQVLLIFDNIENQIRSDQGTYESVLSVWQEALTFFEAIVSGISQKAGNCQSLLALCAWHLYPELMVVDPSPKKTQQNDALMPAKVIVTIGLGQKSGEKAGVCWSLPLAYLRHYGPAVKRKSAVNSTQRLSIEEFEMAFFGTFIVGWTEFGATVFQIAKWLNRIHQILLQGVSWNWFGPEISEACQGSAWLGILFEASKRFLKSFQAGDNNDRQLVRLGQIHGQSFLGNYRDPFFGLHRSGAYVDLLKSEEEKIAHLRDVASKLPGDASSMLIRVRHKCQEFRSGFIFEYLTAKPMRRRCTKRNSEGSQLVTAKHCRWIYKGGDLSKRTGEMCYYDRLLESDTERYAELRPLLDKVRSTRTKSSSKLKDAVKKKFSELLGYEDDYASGSRPSLKSPTNTALHSLSEDFEQRQIIYSAMDEDVLLREDHAIEDNESVDTGIFWATYSDPPLSAESCWYQRIYGTSSAALYMLESAVAGTTSILSKISVLNLLSTFETERLNAERLAAYLLEMAKPHTYSERIKSLRAVSTAVDIYRFLSNATIDVRVLQQDLSKAHWTACAPLVSRGTMDLPHTFSCICFFESGRFDIEASAFRRVMAMSAGDNIWVASPLLYDPYSTLEQLDPGRFGHPTEPVVGLTGNVGCPGINFLVPPMEPMIRPNSIHDFRRIFQAAFDGNLTNEFSDTSLHLSFTSAKSQISGYFEGLKDSELEVVETALSVFERGEWVADLDVLKSLSNNSVWRIPLCPDCKQKRNSEVLHRGFMGQNRPGVTTITNWTELLDPPETKYSIVKASGNWEARLAATVIAVASGYQVGVLPDMWCWKCMEKDRFFRGKEILIA